MLKIRKEIIGELLVYLFPVCFQIAVFRNYGTVNATYAVYIALILYYFLQGRESFYIPNYLFIMLVGVIISYLVVPIFSGYFQMQTIFYSVYALLLALDTYIAADIYVNSENKDNFIRNMAIANAIPLSYQLITNINGYNLTAFMTVFNGSRQGRSYFGYTHPNFAGMFMVIEFILVYMVLRKTEKKYQRGICIVIEVVVLVSVCMTGSRGSLYSCIIFATLELLDLITNAFQKMKKYLYPIAVIVLVFVALVTFGDSLMENGVSRIAGVTSNFQTIYENGTLWFGNGGLSVSSSVEGISHSDNWYMSMIINLGLVGFSILLPTLLYVIGKAIDATNRHNIIPDMIKSLTAMILIYSCAENMLYVPGVGISWLFWFFIHSRILECENIRKNSLETEEEMEGEKNWIWFLLIEQRMKFKRRG